VKEHLISHISADKYEVRMQYIPILEMILIRPLVTQEEEAIDEVIALMDTYPRKRMSKSVGDSIENFT
jgi:hypothetical protein